MAAYKNNATLIEKLRDSWVEYLHTVYVICVIGGWYFASLYDPTEFKARVTLIAILVYFVILLLFLGYFVHAYSRKARYAEAMACVHQAIHEIRDTGTYLTACSQATPAFERAEVKARLSRALESVSRAYSIVTGTNCRAAIKILGGSGSGKAYVRTLARDSASAQSCHDKDEAEKNQHTIAKNTDYNLILNAGRNHFFCNNIASSKEYTNSSTDEYGVKLPYASSIVLPIRSVNMQKAADGADKYLCLGFLAVDSASRNAFLEKYDVQLGAIVADALYTVMDLLATVSQTKGDVPH